jgi:hypothetical protein
VQIVESPTAAAAAAAGSSKQQQQQQDADVVLVDDSDAGQQQQAGGSKAASPASAAAQQAGGWQLPLPLDGSVPLTAAALLAHLPVHSAVHAMECHECAASLQQAAAGHQEVKAAVEGQKQVLGKLMAPGVTEVLEPGVAYYLVPK